MKTRIAILGAGQLAKYLVLAAKKLGLSPTVIATFSFDPACEVSDEVRLGEWTPDSLLQVFQDHEIVTFENEWISEHLLSKVKAAGLINKLLPSFESMKKVRTKWDQKQFFIGQNYATAKTLAPSEINFSTISALQKSLQTFTQGIVIKESELAYDGKGVFVFESQDTEKIKTKLESLTQQNIPWYLEEKVLFKQELALVFSRSKNGEFAHFPLVEFQSEKGICSMVLVQGENSGVMAELENKAVIIAKDLCEKIEWCGTAALEFFYSEQQGLLINEFAPRVHNSGHFTLTASESSQFENHFRAILNLPLGRCTTASFAVMKNLLGSKDSKVAQAPKSTTHAEVFWYGKREIREGRKMGHVTAHGSIQCRDNLIEEVTQVVRKWQIKSSE
ncbi:MAG: ATP-grasp domain-containing protein [Bdellovibrionales bacterium]|nr:ATP-grasp domain-containing protein [Bdellovibrionales bacterium]